MTHERCIERLSEHMDGELAPAEAVAVEDHLSRCPACAEVLAELRGLVAVAARLEDRPPGRDLWPGVASAIGAPRPGLLTIGSRPRPVSVTVRRRVSLSVPQLAAAGLALAFVSGAAAWWARPLAVTPPAIEAPAAPPAAVIPAGALPQERSWAAEVARLELALARSGGLDPATVLVLERNVAIIDRAIRESREALAGDPGNAFLEEHLRRSWERKLSTLREAADLAAWTRS